MKPDTELLAWAAALIQKAQNDGAYGEVVIKLEAGRIVGAQRKDTFRPPKAGERAKMTGC